MNGARHHSRHPTPHLGSKASKVAKKAKASVRVYLIDSPFSVSSNMTLYFSPSLSLSFNITPFPYLPQCGSTNTCRYVRRQRRINERAKLSIISETISLSLFARVQNCACCMKKLISMRTEDTSDQHLQGINQSSCYNIHNGKQKNDT